MPILALAGLRKSGKTAAADTVLEIGRDLGIPIRKIAFADPLKKMFAEKKHINPNLLLDPFAKEQFRYELIQFSKECKKDNPYFFVDALFENCYQGEHIVIDDMRLIEELKTVLEYGGVPCKVECFIRDQRGWEFNKDVDDDNSELELGSLSADTYRRLGGCHIYNNKGLPELRTQLLDVVKKVFIKIS